MMDNVSVVIPVYGQHEYLDKLLLSLEGRLPKKKVIIVDDDSEDLETKKYLREKCGSYRTYMKRKNSGFADTVNYGVSKVETKYVAILNSDIEIPDHQNPIEDCVKRLESDPSIGVMGIKLQTKDGKVQHAGVYMDWATTRPRHRGGEDKQEYNNIEDMPFVTAAFWVLPKSVFDDMGGLPLVYGRGYFEDPDFCTFVRVMGKRVVYNGSVWAYHAAHKSFAAIKYPYADTSQNLFLWRRRCLQLVEMLEKQSDCGKLPDVRLDVDENTRYNYTLGPMHENRGLLYRLIEELEPSNVLELGVEYGGSYFTWAQAIKDKELQTKLVGIDTFSGAPGYGNYGSGVWDVFMKNKMEYLGEDERFEVKKGLFAQFKDEFADHSQDIILIDGTHTLESVARDYSQYLPNLAENGIMLFHDTNHPKWGVKDFWWDISCQFPSYNHRGRFGLGLLFPKGNANYERLVRSGVISNYWEQSIKHQVDANLAKCK